MTNAPDWLWFDGDNLMKITFGRWRKHKGQEKYIREDIAQAMVAASGDRVGFWLSAALEDPSVCDKMKDDIHHFFSCVSGNTVEALEQVKREARNEALREASREVTSMASRMITTDMKEMLSMASKRIMALTKE